MLQKKNDRQYTVLIKSYANNQDQMTHVVLHLDLKINEWKCSKELILTNDVNIDTSVAFEADKEIVDYTIVTSITQCLIRNAQRPFKKEPVINTQGRPVEFVKFVNSETQIALSNWRRRHNLSGTHIVL